MKIVQVCPRYYPYMGGVETHVKEVSERLAKKGFEIEVLTTDPLGKLPKEEVINNVKIKRFKSWAPNNAYYFSRRLKQNLMQNASNYELIHSHSYHAFPALYAAKAKKNNKLVFTAHYHGSGHTFIRGLLHIPYKFVGKEIFSKADRIICVSGAERDLVRRNFHVSSKRISIIPNGINLHEIENAKPYEFDAKLILYSGRLEKYKNIDFIIRSVKHLPNEYKFYVIGSGSFKVDLQRLVKKLRLDKRVKFLEGLKNEEVYGWMKTCSVFVNLSSLEAFGISVLEASAAGKPVLVNDKLGLHELAEMYDGVYPVDINQISVGELAKVIEWMDGMDFKKPDLNDYDWENIVKRIGWEYLELVT